MNNILLLLLVGIFAWMPTHAQEPPVSDTARAAVVGDSLIAVDEQTLVDALVRTVRERRARQADLLQTADLLRTQLLFDLLQGRAQQLGISAPLAAAQTTQTRSSSSGADDYRWQLEQLSSRLSALESVVARGSAVSRTAVPAVSDPELDRLLRERDDLLNRLSRQSRTTVIPAPIPLPVGTSGAAEEKVRKLEARLAALESQRAVLLAERDSLVNDLMANRAAEIPAPTTGVTLAGGRSVAPSARIVEVPADFRRTIYFRVSSVAIGASGEKKLREAADFLRRYPEARVQISGYASPDGTRGYNLRLSQRRKQSVMHRLQQLGVSASRLIAEPGGISSASIGRDRGRRVDIRLAP